MTLESLPFFAWLILKLVTLIGIVVYAVFAGVIVRQERLMSHVLEDGFEPVLRVLTYIHLAGALAVFLLALVLL